MAVSYCTSKDLYGQKALLTDASMLVSTSQLSEVLIWTPEYCNAKIAGNGDTWHSCIESKALSASNATDLTSQKTIVNLDSIARQMRRQTLCASKQREGSHAHICSNAPIIGVITKQTQIYVHSEGTGLTGNGTRKNILRSVKIRSNWFV